MSTGERNLKWLFPKAQKKWMQQRQEGEFFADSGRYSQVGMCWPALGRSSLYDAFSTDDITQIN